MVAVTSSDRTLFTVPKDTPQIATSDGVLGTSGMLDIPDREKVIGRYRLQYRVLAVSMRLSAIAAFVFNEFTRQNSPGYSEYGHLEYIGL
jgi:hypothetical protein